MPIKYILILFLFLSFDLSGQNFNALTKRYDNIKESSLKDRWFVHEDISKLIERFEGNKDIKIDSLGLSWENRKIQSLTFGNGPIKVLLWSQMHGDEPTATGALFDLLNYFFKDTSDKQFKKRILDALTIIMVPMLNPDGAERHQRRTALGIDMNRDALRLTQPESQILKELVKSLKPDFGFNLHDQGRVYGAGLEGQPATISFLAPAYNVARSVNGVRGNAMKVINGMIGFLEPFIPNGMGKYNDEFEPRAFGDNIQKWGTSTILIESGSYKGDPERQYVRKLNFLTILKAFAIISKGDYSTLSTEKYEFLPFNERIYMDKIYREVSLNFEGKPVILDLGFQRSSDRYDGIDKPFNYYLKDKGDLSVYQGYDDVNVKGFEAKIPQVSSFVIKDFDVYNDDDLRKLVHEGIGFIRVENIQQLYQHPSIPILYIPLKFNVKSSFSKSLSLNIFLSKDGKFAKAICRGILYDISTGFK